MKKIDGFESGKGWEEKIWRGFLENVENANHKYKTEAFLDNILTKSEKRFISKRLAALSLIRAGKSYKEIGRILWISPCTISALKKIVNETTNYQSNREYSVKKRNEKSERRRKIPPSTILDYWANLPLPSKTGYLKHNHK